MISNQMSDAINRQIANELHASNSYLSIASYMEGEGYRVLGAHFFRQSEEEREHALKLLRYLLDVGAKVRIDAIPSVQPAFASPAAAVKAALDQELEVTSQINALMALAQKEDDFASASFLKWFVDEQVEEVASMSELLQLLERAGDQHILLVEDRLLRQGAGSGSEA